MDVGEGHPLSYLDALASDASPSPKRHRRDCECEHQGHTLAMRQADDASMVAASAPEGHDAAMVIACGSEANGTMILGASSPGAMTTVPTVAPPEGGGSDAESSATPEPLKGRMVASKTRRLLVRYASDTLAHYQQKVQVSEHMVQDNAQVLSMAGELEQLITKLEHVRGQLAQEALRGDLYGLEVPTQQVDGSVRGSSGGLEESDESEAHGGGVDEADDIDSDESRIR